ncbi:MAG: hypothetical protein AUG83_02840 [Acidobacteria bacterium 13_1_20CM_4_57_11]|nr:MAG: hypothetical protein AUG83_02840 [Acidobacteria bacterium 13_1_20CM_4_57_11]
MASLPSSPENGDQSEFSAEDSSAKPSSSPHHKMSPRNRALFFVTAWLIVLMPFLFWWNTWFGRRLPDKQITVYLQDEKHPRHIQHALIQLGERMGRHDSAAARWYPELIRLASHPVEEVRNTDAWVMGQDTSAPGFHEALLKMLQDSSPMVRGNAALSLVLFHDNSGRPQIVALLQPAKIVAPSVWLRVPTYPPAPKSLLSTRATNKFGKPSALSFLSARLTTYPPSAPISANSLKSLIASASKPCSPRNPSANAPPIAEPLPRLDKKTSNVLAKGYRQSVYPSSGPTWKLSLP